VLAVLGELSEADVGDRSSKDKLRARLKIAINDVLAARGVPGTVDEVFFTSLVVQ
jgi:flagellar basal body-associated protein FliL